MTCPIALVPPEPGVRVIAPDVLIVPAREPAVPAASLVMSPKAGTSPTVGAEVGMVSPTV